MILNEKEVKTCLEYALVPLLKNYSIEIKESHLKISDKIELNGIIFYQNHAVDFWTSFTIDYKDKQLCFENIQGTIEYLFLSLNVLSVLQQLVKDEHLSFKNNSCYYQCVLPIQKLSIEDEHLSIDLK